MKGLCYGLRSDEVNGRPGRGFCLRDRTVSI